MEDAQATRLLPSECNQVQHQLKVPVGGAGAQVGQAGWGVPWGAVVQHSGVQLGVQQAWRPRHDAVCPPGLCRRAGYSHPACGLHSCSWAGLQIKTFIL